MARIDLEAIQAKIDNRDLTISEQQPSQRIFDEAERKLVSWFFAAMRTQWGAGKFNSQFGEGEDVQFAKRHWAPRILKHKPEHLREMLEMADSERINGNEKFMWPDPAMILSLQSNAWERRGHKVFEAPKLLEDKNAKQADLEYRKAQLAKLREETGI